VVSLLCYFLCAITVLTAVAGVMFGLFKSERVRHYPRLVVESNVTATNREPRLFMVVPETKHGSLAKNIESSSAAVPTEKRRLKKASLRSAKCSPVTTSTGTRCVTPKNPRTGQVAYFQLVTQIGGNL